MTMLVFGAVVFSLLAQGLTVAPLLKWLRLTEREPESLEYEVLQGRLLAETAALAELDSLRQRGLIAARVCDDLKAEITATQQTLSERLTSMGGAQRAVEQQQEARIRHHLISVKKTRLTELLREGILSEQSHNEAGRLLDQELTENSKSPEG
jgi:CPA1 family monovalent cation:H+ antiporter